MMLYSESRIHFQPIAPSDIGATHGSSTRNRTKPRPRNLSFSANERMVDPTSTSTWDTIVKMNELDRDFLKLGLSRMVRKFSNPTKWYATLPTFTSPNAYKKARTKGTP